MCMPAHKHPAPGLHVGTQTGLPDLPAPAHRLGPVGVWRVLTYAQAPNGRA